MNEFLLYCAAVNPHLIERCPSQKTKYACIGGAVLATAVLATVSGGYAFFTVFGNLGLAMLFGVAWGVIIFNLDRLFLASIRIHDDIRHEMLMAVPRLLLAALISFVISKPLELQIFRTEIDAEMTRSRTAAYLEEKGKLDNDPAYGDEIKRLEEQNRAERQELAQVEASKNEAYNAYISEAEGTAGSGMAGRGPVFAEKKTEAEKVEGEYKAKKVEVEAQVTRNEARVAEIEDTKKKQLSAMDVSQNAATALLARIRALHALCERDAAVADTSLVVTLLLLALEVCPLVLKSLGAFNKRRPYERLLEAMETEEETRAEVAIHAAEKQAATEKAITEHQEKVRLDEQRRANANIMRSVVDGQHALAQDMVRAWNDQQRDLLQQDPGLFFQVH